MCIYIYSSMIDVVDIAISSVILVFKLLTRL